MKILCITVAVLTITGCISMPASKNYKDLEPKIENYSIPSIGEISDSSVGDNLLTQGTRRTVEAIKLLDSTHRPVSSTSDFYCKFAESDLYHWYADCKSPEFGETDGAATNGTIIKKNKNNGNLCPFKITGGGLSYGYKCYENSNHKVIKKFILNNINSFQQSLIYNGKVGSKINISYREFSDKSARSAFNNNVEYDMSESKTIAYKGAMLNVIEYTNVGIRYKVISNFNTN